MADNPNEQTPGTDQEQNTPPAPPTPEPNETPPEQVTPPANDDAPEGADKLGDAGKKALDAMKEQRNAERDKAKSLATQLEQAQQSSTANETRVQSLSEQVIKANVLASAKGALTNPEDAFAFLDLSQFEVGDDGSVDGSAIDQAISGLVEQRPYLAGEASRFQGSAGGGGHESDPAQQQVTKDEFNRMSPEEVLKASQEGRLKSLLKG